MLIHRFRADRKDAKSDNILQRRRRLCIVIPPHWSVQMGGAQYQAKLLIEHLSSTLEYEIYYLARRLEPGYESQTHTVLQVAEDKGYRRYGYWFDHRRLMRLLNKLNPDIIYQRMGCGYTGTCAWYARTHNCHMVWHVAHDRTLMPMEKGKLLTWPMRYIEHKWMRFGIRNANLIVAQTLWQKTRLATEFGLDSVVIPNFHPIPVNEFKKDEDVVRVLWIANFKPWKQPEIFLQLVEDTDHDNVRYTLVGRPSPDTAWMERLKGSMKRNKHVEYLGAQSQDEVNNLLSKAHILVNTSKYEGFANTFIQAWLRNVPVLSYVVNPDGLLDGKKCGVCAKGSYETLRSELNNWISDSARRRQLGRAGKRHAMKCHSMDNLRTLCEVIDPKR